MTHVSSRRTLVEVERRQRRAKPVLRWAGGKSRLVHYILDYLPNGFHRYLEPMVGGGALFFWISPPNSILSDVNPELINFYEVLRDNGENLINALLRLRASRQLYYRLRSARTRHPFERAVRFAYLNRLCWNGLYRVNRLGRFNVPIGDRLPSRLWHRTDLEQAAQALKATKLMSGDFAQALVLARSGDFVFLDPPYPRGSGSVPDRCDPLGFSRYSSSNFSAADHKRLSHTIQELSNRDVKVMLLLADDSRITRCYSNSLWKHTIFSKSLISCRGESRRQVRELILCNYRL
jgi:DNA adenine methylase